MSLSFMSLLAQSVLDVAYTQAAAVANSQHAGLAERVASPAYKRLAIVFRAACTAVVVQAGWLLVHICRTVECDVSVT